LKVLPILEETTIPFIPSAFIIRDCFWLDCAKLGVLYAKKLEQSPKALPLKIFGGQLFWNFLTHIGLKYKKFHLDDTF
jgi:hypothetical protein